MANETDSTVINNTPPQEFKRDERGLFTHIQHQYRPDGSVDWRKMIPAEYIVPNLERTQETDVTKLEDKDLLILLEGFQQVADLRGFNYVDTTLTAGASESFASAKTTIEWIPNYETQGRTIARSGAADAHFGNTNSFGQSFLTTIAENRSFVRAVRRFLKIPVLGQDELGGKNNKTAQREKEPARESEYLTRLGELLDNNKIAFESFKNQMIKMKVEGADSWEQLGDVPEAQIFEITENVQNALAAAKKRKAEKAAAEAAAKQAS